MLLEALKQEVPDSFWALTLDAFHNGEFSSICITSLRNVYGCYMNGWKFADSVSFIVVVCWKRVDSSFMTLSGTVVKSVHCF